MHINKFAAEMRMQGNGTEHKVMCNHIASGSQSLVRYTLPGNVWIRILANVNLSSCVRHFF